MTCVSAPLAIDFWAGRHWQAEAAHTLHTPLAWPGNTPFPDYCLGMHGYALAGLGILAEK